MTLDTAFEQHFTKILKARIAKMQEELAQRQAVPDYAEYTFRVGAITALRDIVPDLLEETNEILNKR